MKYSIIYKEIKTQIEGRCGFLSNWPTKYNCFDDNWSFATFDINSAYQVKDKEFDNANMYKNRYIFEVREQQ